MMEEGLELMSVVVYCGWQNHLEVLQASPDFHPILLEGIEYLINISYVDDNEILKVTPCLPSRLPVFACLCNHSPCWWCRCVWTTGRCLWGSFTALWGAGRPPPWGHRPPLTTLRVRAMRKQRPWASIST